MSIVLRSALPKDRQQVLEVEKKATPGLTYLPHVFDQFVADETGEFIVAETGDQLVGCGKFTLLPDGSAWLETLRVIPERQGQGIGKMFYQRFLEIAQAKRVSTLRMYTGVNNHASKGLAEHSGFSIAGTYLGQRRPCRLGLPRSVPSAFQEVTDPSVATELLLSYREQWKDFLVINRTFYPITPSLAAYLAGQGQIHYDPNTQSTMTLGARFLPHQALHIGILGGDLSACLLFAIQKGIEAGVEYLSCYTPDGAVELLDNLSRFGFQAEPSNLIVMEERLRL
jgi:ribosomal protein S18 acetylase RimI-like enzyme